MSSSETGGGPSFAKASEGTHRSVLLHEAVENLAIQSNDTVVDATIGGAGHMQAIAKKLGSHGRLIGFDLDEDAIERARNVFSGDSRVHLVQANFRNLQPELDACGVQKIDKILFDLGWSGYQLKGGRGFSFLSNEPLTMTYGKSGTRSHSLTAATIVNEWGESSIADVLFGWGEERYAKRIARAIVAARDRNRIQTARELAEIVKAAVPAAYRYGRIHPATRTFQALRIAVNDELGALENGLCGAWEMLNPEGRIAVITFHSIEDRIVKRIFVARVKEGAGALIAKKPIVPTALEMKENPRSRSAKLRVIEKKAL